MLVFRESIVLYNESSASRNKKANARRISGLNSANDVNYNNNLYFMT